MVNLKINGRDVSVKEGSIYKLQEGAYNQKDQCKADTFPA